MKTLGIAVVVLAGCIAAHVMPGGAQSRTPATVGGGEIVHSVVDVMKSTAFYRDALGLQVVAAPEEAPKLEAPFQALINVPSGLVRSAILRLSDGSPLRLVEVTGRDRRPPPVVKPSDPGVMTLRMSVSSIDDVASRLPNWDAVVVTLGGRPQVVGGRKTLVFRDFDGYVLRLVESGGAAGEQSVLSMTTRNADAKLAFYRDVLGLDVSAGMSWEDDQAMMAAMGSDRGTVRRSRVALTGSSVSFEILEFTGVVQRPYRPRMGGNGVGGPLVPTDDPGNGWLQLRVGDVPSLLRTVKAHDVPIISTSFKPVRFESSTRVLVQDPDGVFVELIEED